MTVHDWGLLEYEKAHQQMLDVHKRACEDGNNHLIICQHPNIFTLGQDEWEKDFNVPVYKTDRGGSITSHSPGQNVYYFCFHTLSPARFFAKVIESFSDFFKKYLPLVTYDKNNPGFYLRDKKLLSLGFRYKDGVSLHGVALNVCVDLNFHHQISPCNLKDIVAGSLQEEGLTLSCEDVNEEIIGILRKVFDESL